MTATLLKKHLSTEDKKFYGSKATRDCLEVKYEDGTKITYVIFRGTWTRSGSCRDCGDYYEIAGYSSYKQIQKSDVIMVEA